MFWKKDKGSVATAEPDALKVKKASPRDVMTAQIDAVEAGKEITFKLGEIYVKPYVTVIRNAPGTGKTFTAYQDGKDSAGNPSGKRGKFWDTNEAKDLAGWILEREGTLYRG